MSSKSASEPARHEGPDRSVLRLADGISLAAAPTFAMLALLAAAQEGGPQAMLCSAAQPFPLLTGMATMYALMSLFHATPWPKLISRRAARHGATFRNKSKHFSFRESPKA